MLCLPSIDHALPSHRHAHARAPAVKMAEIRDEAEIQDEAFCYDLPGAIAPAGEFDPAGLLDGKSKSEVFRLREAELQHGRVSMVACAGFLVQEPFHPLGDNLPVLEQVQHLPDPLLFAIPTVIGFLENARVQRWTGNAVIRGVLPTSNGGPYLGYYPGEIGYYPGDVCFDPLNLKPVDPAELKLMQNRELANGRLAMLAAAGFVAQELATGATWSSWLPTLAS